MADIESMGNQELRQHLRVRTEGKAIIQLADGARVRCTVHDMSLGGAYLIRSTEFGPVAELMAGESITVTMYDTQHGTSYEMDAFVVRAEANGGAGVAIKFALSEETVQPFENHIEWEARKQHVPRSALGVPVLSWKHSKLGSVERISKAVVPAAVFMVVFGLCTVGWTWIKTIMDYG